MTAVERTVYTDSGTATLQRVILPLAGSVRERRSRTSRSTRRTSYLKLQQGKHSLQVKEQVSNVIEVLPGTTLGMQSERTDFYEEGARLHFPGKEPATVFETVAEKSQYNP